MTVKFVSGAFKRRRGRGTNTQEGQDASDKPRIRSANVLLITVRAVGTEIAKNMILNGIGSLTIVDNGIVTDDDLGAQYFLRDEDVGSNVSPIERMTVASEGLLYSSVRKRLLHVFKSSIHVCW